LKFARFVPKSLPIQFFKAKLPFFSLAGRFIQNNLLFEIKAIAPSQVSFSFFEAAPHTKLRVLHTGSPSW
jgi:hypothetical protein